jgi:hypothetical protein
MKNILLVLLAVTIITMLATTPAYASGGIPVGACPPGFDLMQYMDGNHQDMPMHIGLEVDLNSNGYICMKVISPKLHLHVDDVLPLP